MTRELLHWTLQTIIVAGGIWLFLRFVRVTRGSRLIRGLFLTVVVGIAGIWALSRALGLGELEYLVIRAVPFVVVTFAVVFQPELRRAMAQLGERSLVGQLISRSREDSLARVARAARAMAHRRHGALIAFERESSLNTYIEAGTQIDARITARLIESLFNPSGALHDGAVIVRKDRLAAAGCFFPLPQEADMDPSHGTRHRAAVGITEETDAVVLVVSEETGTISLALDGKIRTRIPEDQLQEALEEWLEKRSFATEEKSKRWSFSRDEVFAIAASILLAVGLLFFAHQNLLVTQDYFVDVAAVTPSALRAPTANEILVVLPAENERLLSPRPNERFELRMTGPRAELERVSKHLSGVLTIEDQDWEGGPLDLERVEWLDDSWMLGIETAWGQDGPPELQVLRFASRDVPIDRSWIPLDTSAMDLRYVVDEESITFVPSSDVAVRGPEPVLDKLEILAEQLEFEAVRIGEDDVGERRYPLRLTPAAGARGFELVDEIQVVIDVVPEPRDIGTISADIAIVSFDPERSDEIGRWTLPPNLETARFTIQTRGLFAADADLGTPGMLDLTRTIRQAVERELNVYVDLAELPPEGGGSSLPVRTSWRTDLLSMLDNMKLDPPRIGTFQPLSVRLDSDERVLLSPKNP